MFIQCPNKNYAQILKKNVSSCQTEEIVPIRTTVCDFKTQITDMEKC